MLPNLEGSKSEVLEDLAVEDEEQSPGDHEEQVEGEQDEPGGETIWR